jgi:hypothetical protein
MYSEKELEEKFENMLQISFDKNSVAQWSLLKRVLVYIFYTLLIFIIGLFSIAKKIILLRFLQIRKDFKTMSNMDGIVRKHFTI